MLSQQRSKVKIPMYKLKLLLDGVDKECLPWLALDSTKINFSNWHKCNKIKQFQLCEISTHRHRRRNGNSSQSRLVLWQAVLRIKCSRGWNLQVNCRISHSRRISRSINFNIILRVVCQFSLLPASYIC